MTEHLRRIDRILAAEYLDGLDDRSLDDLRTMERDCAEVETEISYVRRLAQARIDILEAEVIAAPPVGPLGDLIAALPKILADDSPRGAAPASTRVAIGLAPADEHRRGTAGSSA